MSESVPKKPARLSLKANFSWTFAGNVVNAGSWFAMTIVLAQLGSPEHVGQFALGLAMTAPIFMFATLRLRDVQATDVNQEYVFGDYQALRFITTVLAYLVVIGIVVVMDYERELALVILAVAASKAVEAISDGFYGLFMQYERMDRIAKSMMMKGPLSLLGLGIGFYLTGSVFWGAMGLVIARFTILMSYDIHNVVLILGRAPGAKKTAIFKAFPPPRWDAKTLMKLVRLTLPLGFVTMLMSFNTNIPRFFIELHLGAYQLGLFAAIASFQKTAPTVIMALGRSASPRMANYYANNNVKSFRKLVIRLVIISLVLGGAGILVSAVAGAEILTIIFGEEYAMPGLLVMIMIAASMDYLATMLQFGMTAARYFSIQLPIFILTTASVALASFLLIPTAGLEGGAMALIIGTSIRAIGSLLAVLHALRALSKQSAAKVEQEISHIEEP